jgi:hypothetical protein
VNIAASTLGDSFTGDYEHIADVEWADTALDGGWLCLWCRWGAFHIVPVLDIVRHNVVKGDECVCGPEMSVMEDGTWMVSHASLDGRELHEVKS